MPKISELMNVTQQLDSFDNRHGTVIKTALTVYAEEMRKAGKPLAAAYERIKNDPAARAAQDDSQITTEGLRMMAEMMEDSAKHAEAASKAYAELTELLDMED